MSEERIKVIVRRTPTYIAKFVSLSVKPTSFAYEQEFTVNYTIRNEGTGILDAFEVNATIDDRPLRKVGDGSTRYIKLNPGETKSGSFVRKLMHDYPTADLSLGSHSLEVLLFVTPEAAEEPIDVPTDERKLPITLIGAPETVRVTSDSPIPLWFCDENGCAKMPCTRGSSYGISFGILDGRYPADAEKEIDVGTVDTMEETTWGFNWGGYKGSVTVNWGAGKVHVKLDEYPPLEKQCAVKFTPSGYILDMKEWTRMSTPCTYDCFAKETSPGVWECITTVGIQKYPEWLCEHGKLVITLKAGVWTIDTEKTSDCLVGLLDADGSATGITLTIGEPSKEEMTKSEFLAELATRSKGRKIDLRWMPITQPALNTGNWTRPGEDGVEFEPNNIRYGDGVRWSIGIKLATRNPPTDVGVIMFTDLPPGKQVESIERAVAITALDKLRFVRPDVNITIDSPIPLFYSDDAGTVSLPIKIAPGFNLGFAVCDGRYDDWKCWERWEECVIYEDYITDYKGVVNKTINIKGYRGTVRIDFTTIPYTMHVVITDYPEVPEREGMGVGGHVRDKETGKLITEGRVIHVETGESVSIDHTGYYDFDIVEYTGLQHYRAEVAGYDALVKEVAVTKDRTDRLDFELAKAPSKPVTITPSELRWTNGTYRAAFRIGNLTRTTRYRVALLDAEGNEIDAKRVTGIYMTDILADILKSDLDEYGYKLSCSVHNSDTDGRFGKT
jgi:hypothetical protein